MKICLVSIILLIGVHSALCQVSVETTCDPDCVEVVRNLIKAQKTGFSTSWTEKQNRGLGDRIASGLRRVFPGKEVSRPETVRLLLPIITEAFADPAMIEVESLRAPTQTLKLLTQIAAATEDETVREQIRTLVLWLGKDRRGADEDLLPAPTVTFNCADVLRYIDDGAMRASRANGSLFLVVRVKDRSEARIAAIRTNNLSRYFRSQGIDFVEVLADLSAGRSGIIDVYVDGEKLYSLPIKKNETMKWVNC